MFSKHIDSMWLFFNQSHVYSCKITSVCEMYIKYTFFTQLQNVFVIIYISSTSLAS